MSLFKRGAVVTVITALLILAWLAVLAAHRAFPSIGANALLHPARHRLDPASRAQHRSTTFEGKDVRLEGWKLDAAGHRRGTVVYLHGVADNRGSAAGPAERLVARGFDFVAYDSRAHGDSGGDACTYGFYEKHDLKRVLDVLAPGPVVLIGTSLGAAVALQAAAEDVRISAVVAAESFSDLRTVAAERAPWFFTQPAIRHSFALAETRGRFQVASVSPLLAANHIDVPVFLVHGELDRETPADHSRRIFDSLHGPKWLMIVPGVGHNQSLQPSVWRVLEEWIDSVVTGGDR